MHSSHTIHTIQTIHTIHTAHTELTPSLHTAHTQFTQLIIHTTHTQLTHKDPVPEEKAKGSHLSQVYSEDTTHLLEGKYLLLFIPSGALCLPIVLLELGTGVEAGGRAGGAGHAIVTRVPVDRACGQKLCQPREAAHATIQKPLVRALKLAFIHQLNYFYLN